MLSKPIPNLGKTEEKELDTNFLLLSYLEGQDVFGIEFKEKIVFFYKDKKGQAKQTFH